MDRADVEKTLEAARLAFESDLQTLTETRDFLGDAQALLQREGFSTVRAAGFLRAFRPREEQNPRILLHHELGPPTVRRIGIERALAAVHGLPRAAEGVDLEIGLSAGDGNDLRSGLEASPPSVQGVILGSGFWPGSRPTAITGARGRLRLRVVLSTGKSPAPRADRVSGLARNALAELAELVGGLSNAKTGAIQVPGLTDSASDMTIAEAQHFALSGFDLNDLAEQEGLRLPRYNDPLEAMEGLWTRPALELLELESPAPFGRFPTEARAVLAVYLVPEMKASTTMDLLTQHIRRRTPDASVEYIDHVEAWSGKIPGPLANGLREAYRAGFGTRAALVRHAEPVPEAVAFRSVLNVPLACAPTAPYEAPEPPSFADIASTATLYGALARLWATVLGG